MHAAAAIRSPGIERAQLTYVRLALNVIALCWRRRRRLIYVRTYDEHICVCLCLGVDGFACLPAPNAVTDYDNTTVNVTPEAI